MGVRAQVIVAADGTISVEDVETVDVPLSTGFALTVGTGDAPDVDRTWVDENGTLTAGQGVGVSYADESVALFARMAAAGAEPDDEHKAIYDAFISGLIADDLWDGADEIKVYAAHGAEHLNWRQDAHNDTDIGAGPTHTPGAGIAGNGSTTGVDRNINIGAGGLNAARDNHSYFIWVNTESQATIADVGGSDFSICARDGGTDMIVRSSSTTTDTQAVISSLGMAGFIRDNSANFKMFHQNRNITPTPKSRASSAPASHDQYACGRNNGSGTLTLPTTREQSGLYLGAAHTEEKQNSLFWRFHRLFAALGMIPSLDGYASSEMRVDFADKANGALPTLCDTGQALTVFEPNSDNLAVLDGALVLENVPGTGVAASYTEVELTGPVARMGATVSFDDQSGALATNNGVAVLAIWGDGGIVAEGSGRRAKLHATFGPTQTVVQYRTVEDGSFVTAMSHAHETTLSEDGTIYRVEVAFDGTTAWVLCPDGHVIVVTNANFEDAHTDKVFASHELFMADSDTDSRPRIHRIWADS